MSSLNTEQLLTEQEIQEIGSELYQELFGSDMSEYQGLQNMHKNICKQEQINEVKEFDKNIQSQYRDILDFDNNGVVNEDDFKQLAYYYLYQVNQKTKKRIKLDKKLTQQANDRIKIGFQEFWEIDLFRSCYLEEADEIQDLVLNTLSKWGTLTKNNASEKIQEFYQFCLNNQIQSKLTLEDFEEYMLEQLEQENIQLYQ